MPQLGFDWEFELTLKERLRKNEHEIIARFQRYGRFGMRLEEARLPTPDNFRADYDELVESINNDRTPSLSPAYAADSTQKHRKGKDITKKGSRQKQEKAMRPRHRKQANHREGSSHGMTTRSKTAALQRI